MIGYLDLEAVTINKDGTESKKSILYVKDNNDYFKGYLYIENQLIEYNECEFIEIKGKYLLADSIETILKHLIEE